MRKYFKCFIAALFLSAVMFSVSFSADKKEKKEEFKIDKAFLDLFKMSGNEKIAVIPPVNKDNYVMDFFKKEGLMDKVKILSPKELVNRKIFNYRKYKIAFYLGYENYVQSVNSPGDGDRAITEYVESGGTLFVFANGPSPFYYNEKGTVVDYAVTLNLGIIKGKQDQYMTVGEAFEFLNKLLNTKIILSILLILSNYFLTGLTGWTG